MDNLSMRIQVVATPIAEISTPWLVLGLFEGEVGLRGAMEESGLAATVERLRASKDVTGSLGDLTAIHDPAGVAAGSVLLVGLGPRGRFDAGATFTAAVA